MNCTIFSKKRLLSSLPPNRALVTIGTLNLPVVKIASCWLGWPAPRNRTKDHGRSDGHMARAVCRWWFPSLISSSYRLSSALCCLLPAPPRLWSVPFLVLVRQEQWEGLVFKWVFWLCTHAIVVSEAGTLITQDNMQFHPHGRLEWNVWLQGIIKTSLDFALPGTLVAKGQSPSSQ